MKKKLKILGVVAATLLVVLVIGLGLLKVWLDSGYFDGYEPDAPLDARVVEQTKTPDYVRTHFYYKGWRGDEVPALMAMPLEHQGPVPAIIFLHGIGQDKDFLDEIAAPFTKAGFAFTSFDQYTQGERETRHLSTWAQAKAFRLRPASTVNDTRRMIDYLETRPDIAANRIYLVGASYGAITGATAAAFDDRLDAAVLVYGGGNLTKLLDARDIAEGAGRWLPLLKIAGWYFFGVTDPVHYVGRISPRPVYFQNGAHDRLISEAAAIALQEAAGDPKKIQWYESDHVGDDETHTRQVLQDVLEYLVEMDAGRTRS